VSLSALDNIDGPGNALEVCVNNIKIKDKRAFLAAQAAQIPKPPPISPQKTTIPNPPPLLPKSNFTYKLGSILRNQNPE